MALSTNTSDEKSERNSVKLSANLSRLSDSGRSDAITCSRSPSPADTPESEGEDDLFISRYLEGITLHFTSSQPAPCDLGNTIRMTLRTLRGTEIKEEVLLERVSATAWRCPLFVLLPRNGSRSGVAISISSGSPEVELGHIAITSEQLDKWKTTAVFSRDVRRTSNIPGFGLVANLHRQCARTRI